MADSTRVIVTDANVLINLCHTGRLEWLGRLAGFEFMVPDHVLQEISDDEQRSQVSEALTRRWLTQVAITDPAEIEVYTQLRQIMGHGEAACLALAESRGWLVASDEKRTFRREAESRLGNGHILTTPGLYVLAIRSGLVTVYEADRDKAVLEQHRFKMAFGSFREVL